MTAKQIFEEFCKLPQTEQDEVIANLMGLRCSANGSKARPEVTAEFKRIAAEVFETNTELFKKLAD